ncbi:hypothetical protein Q5Y75_05790 [Ruegeria sp. 2205SS24-7]|uniref:hypothetical protein n=1 Tax=Ruegeria discodermiae TaxID=3064389 RepID=UPI002742258B|nr:hypothetical protein [Ruegeria sp. 2205SS24-7]MDP5216723.1 hypothetical protein [Ruegeria sp. 2205SS24-7]
MTAYYAIPPAAALAGVGWYLWCRKAERIAARNAKAVCDRIRVLDELNRPISSALLFRELRAVKHLYHERAVRYFRDPAKLYGPNVARILRPENGDE